MSKALTISLVALTLAACGQSTIPAQSQTMAAVANSAKPSDDDATIALVRNANYHLFDAASHISSINRPFPT